MARRGRPSKLDPRKVWAILQVLQQYPSGIWLRQLAREAKIPVSTVNFYIDRLFDPFVESIGFRRPDNRFLGPRIIRFKPGKRTVTVKDILNYQQVKASIAGEPIQTALEKRQ
ncbi:MAG: hypothetical protein QW751_01825 [Candidatus Aenigmatarchaeota archaeon]